MSFNKRSHNSSGVNNNNQSSNINNNNNNAPTKNDVKNSNDDAIRTSSITTGQNQNYTVNRTSINTLSLSNKLVYSAASNNAQPILNVMQQYLGRNVKKAKCLEIGSGTGQHCHLFATQFPNISFQPSEVDRRLFSSINAYAAECPAKNMLPPIEIDISLSFRLWPSINKNFTLSENSLHYIYVCNLLHVAPISIIQCLLSNAGHLLKHRLGHLIIYGPFMENGNMVESNRQFDQNLRASNPQYGIRDLLTISKMAKFKHLQLVNTIDMPSNNKILVFCKL